MRVLKQISLLSFTCIALALFLLACSNDANVMQVNRNGDVSNSDSYSFNREEFERNRELWRSKNITNYEMVMEARNSTNIANRVEIKVEDGKAKSVVKTDSSNRGTAEQYKSYDTVEKVFEIVERESKFKHDVLTVIYDPTLGYPKGVISDRSREIADEEFSISILNLKPKYKDFL